ncbi:MAG: response regulator [Bacteroidota bacterium]
MHIPFPYIRLRLICFFLLLLSIATGQTDKIDSLKLVLDKTSESDADVYLEALFEYGNAMQESSIDTALNMGLKGLAFADKMRLDDKMVSFNRLLANCYGRMGMFREAIKHLENLAELYKKQENEDDVIKTNINIGSYYTRLDPEKSMPYFNKAVEALTNKDKPKLIASLNQSMGIAFYYKQNFNQAGTHLEKAIEANKQIKDWKELSGNYNILGLIRQELEQYDLAEESFLNALQLAEQHKLNYSKIGILSNLGRFYSSARNQQEIGSDYIRYAYEAALQAGYTLRAANILTSLAGVYVDLSNTKKAIATLQESLELQENLDDTQLMMSTLGQISQLYSEEGDYKSAYEYFTRFNTLQDSLVNEQNLQDIAELEKKYKTQEQQTQIQLQDTELKEQRNKLLAISLVALLLAALAFFIWRNNQQKKKINSQLRQLDTSKSRFFANISHELRTPLTLILAPLDSAIKKVKSKSVKEDLKLAHTNSKKLYGLINEILDLSKLDSGKLQLKESSVELEKLLRRIFFSYQSLAQIRGFNLKFSNHLPQDIGIQVDIEKLEKVMNNLISNAFKHSSTGDTIAMDISDNNGTLCIEVKDTGKGISGDHINKIFDRYYQVETEGEPLQGGTGIGLSYAKEIALLFGGDLRVESKLGEGSNFIFTFPLKKVDIKMSFSEGSEFDSEIAETITPTYSFPNGKPKLLIVEDNLEMSKFLVQSLTGQFECTAALDGVEALNKLQKHKYDLITTDVMMPNMDGFTFVKKVHEKEDFLTTPVIMLTARTLEEDKLRGFQLGVDDYLTKPFSTSELIARINNLLKNKEAREQWYRQNSSQGTDTEIEERPLSFEKQLLKTAEEIVLKNLSNSHFKISDFAQELNYSQRQVERIIKKLTGFSPVGFVREIRLQKAYQMIESRQFATISEVRFEVGMENASHFTKKFQERFGKNPNEV